VINTRSDVAEWPRTTWYHIDSLCPLLVYIYPIVLWNRPSVGPLTILLIKLLKSYSLVLMYSLHSPKLALRGVTSDLVTDMCMYCHGIIGVSTHDYGRALLWQISPTHAVSVTYRLGVTAAG
jgi:hypothetical protein